MTIDFRKHADDLFSEVFYLCRKALRQYTGKRFFLLYGGATSSKSYSEHQSELINLMKMDCDILIMRKVGADIYDSCYKLLETIANDWGMYDLFEWTYSQAKRQIRYKKTGHRIIFRGADDIKKVKSIAGIGRIVLEEADAFEFSDFKEINRRVRGFENIQVVLILNPVDEEHWIKKMFWDPEGVYHDRTHIVFVTYHNNKFATADDILELEIMKEIDEYDYEVYALGKWGRIRSGSEFYPHFKESKHVGKVPFLEHLPIHLTYDFNSVPYMTLLCHQYEETEDEIIHRQFAEYCLESPLNSVESVSQAFVDDYEKYLKDIFFYGDASGHSRIAGKGDEVNYDDVRKVLHRWIHDGSDRTRSQNLGIMLRRKLVNKCLSGNLRLGRKKVKIIIDESCEHSRKDFRYLKLGQNGKLKEMGENKKSGVTFVKYGHCTDAFEYEFCELFENLM